MSSLTPFTDMAPVPRVLIDVPVDEFPAGAVTVSLVRTCGGRAMQVRGGQNMTAGAPVVVVDYEPGFGVPCDYTLMGYDASGNVVGSWPVGSTVVDTSRVVIQQPLDPKLSVEAVRLEGWAPSRVRKTPGELAFAQGQSLPGLVNLGPRRGLEGVEIDILLDSLEDADTLQDSLGGYGARQLPVWLIRTPPGGRMPSVFFCHVPELEEVDLANTANPDDLRFRAKVTECRPPAVGVTAAVLTYSDVNVFYATYSQVKARYATYSDVKRDTSMIGAASA